jgi:hypothetical protein
MTGEVLGGGVIVALAAALWLAYLVPTWLRRREYQATERNAVRLQQTLRILAETSEVPNEVRLEVSAREIAVQERILRKSRERTLAEIAEQARAQAQRNHAQALSAAAAARAAASVDDAGRGSASVVAAAPAVGATDALRARGRRLRRARATTSVVLLTGLIMAGWGAAQYVTGAAWLTLATGLVAVGACVVVLHRLARAGRTRLAVSMSTTRLQATQLFDQAEHSAPVERQHSTWTPRPLPKPLYLSRGTIAASAMASVDAVTQLRRAAAQADLERRAAEIAPTLSPALAPVAQFTPRAALQSEEHVAPAVLPEVAPERQTPSRFARMGLLEQVETDSLDLDAVLRRRRAAS